MAEGGGNVNRERLVPREHVADMPEGQDTIMRRVQPVPQNEEPPDLLETCFERFFQSPCIRYSTYIIVVALLVLPVSFYIMIAHDFFIGIAVMFVAIIILGVGLFLLVKRGTHNPIAVRPKERPNLPGYVPARTPPVRGSRRWQVATIDFRNPPTPSSAHIGDPGVPGPSGLQQPVRPIPDEHFSRTLRSGKKTSGLISPRSERHRVQAPVAGESSGRRRVSEVTSSQSQSGAKSMNRRKKISNRRASIHEQSISSPASD